MKNSFAYLCILIIIIFSSCALLQGCTSTNHQSLESELFDRFNNTNGEQADHMFSELIQTIEDKNTSTFKTLFSPCIIETQENFNDNISSLFDFYDGEMISFKRYGPGSNSFKEGNIYSKEIFASYDVITTKGMYRISILFCTVDTQTPGNVGILSLYIIRAENSDTDHAYWGDDSWSPGINIESSENTISMTG